MSAIDYTEKRTIDLKSQKLKLMVNVFRTTIYIKNMYCMISHKQITYMK